VNAAEIIVLVLVSIVGAAVLEAKSRYAVPNDLDGIRR